GTFDPGETWQYSATAPAKTGQYENVGSVTAQDQNQHHVSDTALCHYFVASPSLTIKKFVNGQDADTSTGPVLEARTPVTFTSFVDTPATVPSTTPRVPHHNATLADPSFNSPPTHRHPPSFPTRRSSDLGTFDPGETWQYSATAPARGGQYENVGSA